VVIVAQERSFGDEPGQSEIITPVVGASFTKSVVEWLNPTVDYIVQTYLRPRMRTVKRRLNGKTTESQVRDKGVEYCLRTEPHEIYTIKFRVPMGTTLPECIVDPTYAKIQALIQGE
jgi:hypothetical protein